MSIQVLADDVISQIAAGEVVERPASVVKELLENAIDANARQIHISITGDGRKRIRITDDGNGIPSSEVETAFLRHATSKLRSIDDLFRIYTLGFRGEALASIASVSSVTLATRHESDAMGTLLHLEGGKLKQRKNVGLPSGTILTIENLFFNTPARLKFLKSESTEKRQIATVITRYAMAYPHIRFILEQDEREIFRTSGSGYLLDVMMSALGLENIKNMFEVEDEHHEIRVFGFTSTPSFNRADRNRITLFINGRWIQDSSLTYAVIQAYHTLLMTGRYPIAVLNIQMPPELVDVNVHPTKAEVRFQQPDAVFSAVQRAVRRAVIHHAQMPIVRDGQMNDPDSAQQVWNYQPSQRLSPPPQDQQLDLEMDIRDSGQWARKQYDETTGEHYSSAGVDMSQNPRSLPVLRVVGQVAASYIIAEGPAGMYLLDQHAAHERVLYEQFMMEHEAKTPTKQYTLAAQTIQLPPAESAILEASLNVLSEIGFEIEPFGTSVFIVRAVPAILADRDPLEVIHDILQDLEGGKAPGQQAVEAKIIMRVCKQAAIKAGQILSMEQMTGLIRQLERCQSPLTCPHGRPTMIHMTSDQLAREFGRIH